MKPDSRGVATSRASRPAYEPQPSPETVHRGVGSLAYERVELVRIRVIEKVFDIAFDGHSGERFLDPLHHEHEAHQQHWKREYEEDGHGVVIVPQ